MADVAHAILLSPSCECTGNFFIDDALPYVTGVHDFSRSKMAPSAGWREGMYLFDDDSAPPGAL
jgi:citronellol/citronellal dehydrogenase